MGTSLTGSQVSLFQGGVSSLNSSVSDLMAGLYTAPAEAAAASAQADAASASAQADILQGQGDILEGATYGEAANLATLNAQYTAASTNIQEAQAQRSLYGVLGSIKAQAGGAGLSDSGSVGDILRTSAQQGALNEQIIGAQGQIQEAGYNEQAQSYEQQQQAAGIAAQAEDVSAQGAQQASAEYQQEASLLNESSASDFISAALQGVTGVAELALAA